MVTVPLEYLIGCSIRISQSCIVFGVIGKGKIPPVTLPLLTTKITHKISFQLFYSLPSITFSYTNSLDKASRLLLIFCLHMKREQSPFQLERMWYS